MRSGPQVLVFPFYRENPYLNLMQLAPAAAGFRIIPADAYEDLVAGARRLARGDVLHLHWTAPLLQQAPSQAVAVARLDALRELFASLPGRGISLVWTVHNRLPHELAFPDLEVALIRLLAASADRIHAMAPHTRAALAGIADLPSERMVALPHPSYEGIYETGVTRAAARASFGLAEERAALFLGQIRPYKGVDDLVAAARRASPLLPDRGLALLLAGEVREMSQEEFAASLPGDVTTTAHLDFVPDADLARWFRAADVAVFPYRAILNSGSVHLAATFRVPVILPADDQLIEQFRGQEWAAFFDPEHAEESLAELLSDPDLFAGVGPESFQDFLADIAPWDVSRRYAALLTELSDAATA